MASLVIRHLKTCVSDYLVENCKRRHYEKSGGMYACAIVRTFMSTEGDKEICAERLM